MTETTLCPRCGAYWRCDCRLEDLRPLADPACQHDWTEAVGVDVDVEVAPPGARVNVCRLCGIYSVSETT